MKELSKINGDNYNLAIQISIEILILSDNFAILFNEFWNLMKELSIES